MPGLSDTFYEEMSKKAESMTLDEARARMIRAGIIDENGQLSAQYKPEPGEDQTPEILSKQG